MRQLLGFILICLSLSIYGQSDDWIVKLSEEGYQSIFNTKSTSNQWTVDVISKRLQLVNIKTSQKLEASELQLQLATYAPIRLYPNEKLQKRDRIPDDFYYSDQWSMDVIGAPQVWEYTTGGKTVNGKEIVVAILDDGYQLSHEDIEPNIWLNQAEIPNDNLDNDGNGVRDDYRGYNVDTMNDDLSITSHGTKVLGIIGSKGNNGVGVSGINWDIKILPIGGIDMVLEIMRAMDYIITMKEMYNTSNGLKGANIMVTNLSSGLDRAFPESRPDWCEFYDLAGELGILSVSAVPNSLYNVDEEGDLPTLCQSDFLITVTNTDETDERYVDAAIGPVNVDIGAPGESVLTTAVGSDYGPISGTSSSAPHVAGAVALLFSTPCTEFGDLLDQDPRAAALAVKAAIMEGASQRNSLDQTVSKGRLNINDAFIRIANFCTNQPIGDLSIRSASFSDYQLHVAYNTASQAMHTVSIYSTLGELIKSYEFMPNLFSERIHSKYVDIILPQGTYVATLSLEDESVSLPFVVMTK